MRARVGGRVGNRVVDRLLEPLDSGDGVVDLGQVVHHRRLLRSVLEGLGSHPLHVLRSPRLGLLGRPAPMTKEKLSEAMTCS
jgi:hypothetical protein